MFCVLIYVFSQYFRNSISIIAPNLRSEFLLEPQQIAFLALIFFLTFTIVQLPLGLIIDRFGPRKSIGVCIIITTIGSVIFSQAHNFDNLVLGRALMGLGCSSFFMAPLVLFTQYFSTTQFSSLTTIQLSFGNLGAWLSTAPLGYAVQKYGWPNTFLFSSIAMFCIGMLAVMIIRDKPIIPKQSNLSTPTTSFFTDLKTQISGFKDVIKIRSFWPILIMHFCHYGPLAMMNALWAGPFLSDVHNLNVAERGEILGYAGVTLVISFFVWNRIELLLKQRKIVVIFATILSIISLTILSLYNDISISLTTFLIGVFYFSMGHTPCLITHGRTMIPSHIIGRGITTFNMGIMGGVLFFQWFTGFIISLVDNVPHKTSFSISFQAYQYAFLSTVALMIVGLIIYLFSQEKSFVETEK